MPAIYGENTKNHPGSSLLVNTENVLLHSRSKILPTAGQVPTVFSKSYHLSVKTSSIARRFEKCENKLLQSSLATNARLLSVNNSLLSATSVKSTKPVLLSRTLSLQPTLEPTKRKLSEPCLSLEKKHKVEEDIPLPKLTASLPVRLGEGENMPQYRLEKMHFEEPEKVNFSALLDDPEFKIKQQKENQELLKIAFLTTVSTSLVNSPKFSNPEDGTRKLLIEQAAEVSKIDPEFILKVALYTRQELNIRRAANFLLSYASHCEACRPYLKKYFKDAIRLPSDWIEVAEIYQTFSDKKLKGGSIPAILRKVMKEKFADFDDYQLAKYNKIPSMKKAKVTTENAQESEVQEQVVMDEMETSEDLAKRAFTLKRLIRLLHIDKPSSAVMSLLGKRYPSDAEEFRRSRLPGLWEISRAGERLKLPVPQIWETQLSLHGNTKQVWEKLIDDRKLPYMATLRNLRNLILAKISGKHQQQIQAMISKENAVIKSRQFPLSFYSAYKAVTDLKNDVEKAEKQPFKANPSKPVHAWENRKKKKAMKKLESIDEAVFPKYLEAVEKAMQISVQNNLDPIPGRTLVISDVLSCKSEGENKSMEKLYTCNLLLAMMCLHACEECELQVVWGSVPWMEFCLDGNTLLNRVLSIIKILKEKDKSSTPVPERLAIFYKMFFDGHLNEYLSPAVIHLKQLNSILLLTNGKAFRATEGPRILKSFLHKYRAFVNPKLLFIQVDVSGSSSSLEEASSPLNNYLAGTSDQLLRFMSERGSGTQLSYVENIDKKFDLKSMPKPILKDAFHENQKMAVYKTISSLPEWRTVRVFISSTFKDMHGERDLLVRYVFPELRARARSLRLNIHEVDLRWGITEEEACSQGSLELCLTEVARCQLFIGILGERYGWIPNVDQIPSDTSFDWIREYPHPASVTELEIYNAGLMDPKSAKCRAFFFLRNTKFEEEIPSEWQESFLCENCTCQEKMASLKDRIRKSGLEVFDGYPCKWGGVVSGCPIVSGLEQFGQRILDNLWNSITKLYSLQVDEASSAENGYQIHLEKAQQFSELIGREHLVSNCLKNLCDGILVIPGKSGSGKTAFLGHLFHKLPSENTFVYFVGLSKNDSTLADLATTLIQEICQRCCISFFLPAYKANLINVMWEILRQAASLQGHITLLIDGIENHKETGAATFDWLPYTLPPGVRLVLTATEDSLSYRALLSRAEHGMPVSLSASVEPLTLDKRKEFVSSTLRPHRKTLSSDPFNNQMLLLVTKRDAGFPVYLQLACEELMKFGIFEELTKKIRTLPPTVPLLLQSVTNHMEIAHGKNFANVTLALLSIAREGLKEHELEKLLNVYVSLPTLDLSLEDMLRAFYNAETSIIPMEFSLFCRALRSFLSPSNSASNEDDTISLSHPSIQKVVLNRYLGQTSKLVKYHKFLAAYFISIADYTGDNKWLGSSPRAYRYIPYHLLSANCVRELAPLFCSLEFLSAVCTVGVASSVLDDVRCMHQQTGDLIKNKLSGTSTDQDHSLTKSFDDYINFLSRNMNTLNQFPFHVYQQALNETSDSSVASEAENLRFQNDAFHWLSKPSASHPCYLSLTDFPQELLCVATSSDGKYIAQGGPDTLVHMLNADTGKLVRTYTGHSQSVSSLCFVGGRRLCSGSYDGTLSLWDIEKGIRIAVLVGHMKRVSSCCSDPVGNTVVSVSWDNTLRVWSARDGRVISCISKNKCPLTSVTFHPSKQVVITGGWDKCVKIWDLENMTRKAVFRGHTSSVQCVACSPNGLYIASGDLHGGLCIWSSISGAALSRIVGHLRSISCLVFLPSGDAFVSGSRDGTLKVWGNHWHWKSASKWKLSTHVTVVCFLSLHYVAVGSEEGTVNIYNINKGTTIWTDESSKEAVRCLSRCDFFSSAPCVLVGTELGSLRITALKHKGKELGSVQSCVTAAAASCNFVVAGNASGQVLAFSTSLPDNECCIDCTDGHQGQVTSCCLASGEIFITTGSDKCIRSWQLDSGHLISGEIIPSGHTDCITASAYDNGLLVTGSQDAIVRLWDFDSQTLAGSLTEMDGPVIFLAVEGDYIFGGSKNGSVCVWTRNGRLVSLLSAPENNAQHRSTVGFTFKIGRNTGDKRDVIYSGYLATVEESGELAIRKPFSHNQIISLEGHEGPVTSCAVLENGNIVSSSTDGSLRFWAVAEAPAAKHHKSSIVAAGIAQNGKVAFSADGKGFVLWAVKDSSLAFTGEMKVGEECYMTAASFNHAEGRTVLCAEYTKSKSCIRQYTSKQSEHTLNFVSRTNAEVASEVTSIYWHPSIGSILATLKSGVIVILDWKLTSQVTIQGGQNWSITARFRSPFHIVAAVNRTVKEFTLPKSSWPAIVSSKPTSRYKAAPDESAVITALEIVKETIYTGDSLGVLTVKTGDDLQSLRIHKHGIIGLCFWKKYQYMFTASRDGTVKAWLREELKQVGLFNFPVAVTCLSVHDLERKGENCAQMLIGTMSGETHLLLWKTGSQTQQTGLDFW